MAVNADYGMVSIVMPSYNTADYIAESVESIMGQTYPNWELLIVDDCSTDDTLAVLEQFDDDRIKLLVNKRNSGAAVSRNRALREARGRWVAFLDSDDLWTPDKLQKQLDFMVDNGYSFSFTDYHPMSQEGIMDDTVIIGPDCVDKKRMYRYCYLGALTVMYDAEVVGVIQVADIKKNNDYAMWLQAVEKSTAHRLPLPLAYYRCRAGSISSGNKLKLIKHHYILFRQACGFGIVRSCAYTAQNLIFGLHKKVIYSKRGLYR